MTPTVVTYTVHEPPNPAADRVDRADELRFIRDGFSWTTALLPPLGLAMKRLWLPLIIYLAAAATLSAALTWAGTDPAWQALMFCAIGLYLGYEVSSIERYSLDRAGWQMAGTVTGRNIAECERRFFESWLPDQPIITASKTQRATGETSRSAWPFGAKA